MDRRPFSVAAAIGLGLVLPLLLASSASAFIYWADTQNQTIGRAANDGTEVNDAFIHTGALPFAVAVDAGHVYWVNQNDNSIGRANIDGSGVDNGFITGISEPDGIAVNGSFVYWSTIPGPIGRAGLDGLGVSKSFITGAVQPCGLALDSGHVYWVDEALSEAKIGRSSLDGTFVQPEFVKIGVAFPCGVAVNSANVYWADTGIFGGGTRIGRADLPGGGGVDPSFIGGAATPCGVALDAESHLYWANTKTNAIARANSDGTGVDQSFVATGGNQICGVAVDGLSSPPRQPAQPAAPAPAAKDVTPPHARIRKGPGGDLAVGKARFAFGSSEAGSRFLCRLDRAKAKPCRSPKRYSGLRPGSHAFKVWAIDAAGNKSPKPAQRRFKVPA